MRLFSCHCDTIPLILLVLNYGSVSLSKEAEGEAISNN